MTDIFLSYSREDQTTARRFAEGLQRAGFSVWWDQALHPGEAFDEVTERALEEAKAVIVLWSKASVNSRWVRAEATQANANNRLVPAMIEPCKRPIMFELTHTAELAAWRGDDDDPQWRVFIASLQRFVDGRASDGAPSAAAPAATVRGGSKRARVTVISLLGLLALGLVAGLALRHSGQQQRQIAAPAGASQERITLAVLPFANRLGADQSGIGYGVADGLRDQLGQVSRLRLIGWQSSDRTWDSGEDPRSIGAKLRAQFLLSGTVQQAGTEVLIFAELTDAGDGSQTWSESYRRQLSDAFTLYQEIAKDVAQKVGIVLAVGDLPPDRGGTRNVDAYLAYLGATNILRRGQRTELPQALQLLREAVKLDPSFHMADFVLYAFLGPAMQSYSDNAVVWVREQKEIGLRLDSAPADWQLSSGFKADRLMSQRKWSEALDAVAGMSDASRGPLLDRAGSEAMYLIRAGRLSDGALALRRSIDADPLAGFQSTLLQQVLRVLGHDDLATGERRRFEAEWGAEEVPRNELGEPTSLAEWSGHSTDARALDALKERLRGQDGKIAGSGFMDGEPVTMLDDAGAVRLALRKAIENPANVSEGRLVTLAGFAAFFGDPAMAVDALRRLDGRWSPLTLWQDQRLRGEPAFKELVSELGLVEYWRQTKWGDFCKPIEGTNDFTCH